VLEALLWLKKHNPFYANVSIKEDNLEWMQGEDEVASLKCREIQNDELKAVPNHC
jgi:hypothetical protein